MLVKPGVKEAFHGRKIPQEEHIQPALGQRCVSGHKPPCRKTHSLRLTRRVLHADYRALHLISSYLNSVNFYLSALKNASHASACNSNHLPQKITGRGKKLERGFGDRHPEERLAAGFFGISVRKQGFPAQPVRHPL